MGTFYIAGVAESASFPELLNGFVRRFGSQTALGKAIDISASRLSRVIQGQHSLEVVNCLRLAEVTGESPSVVLRAAGKADVADLIERMYGDAREPIAPAMTPAQRDVITLFESMSDEGRETARGILESLSKAMPRPQPQESLSRSARTRAAAKNKARGTR